MMILRKKITAQSTIEFTFAMVAIIFLIWGMVRIFRWAGMDIAQKRYVQDTSLTISLNAYGGDPAAQFNSDIDSIMPMSAVYPGRITNGVGNKSP